MFKRFHAILHLYIAYLNKYNTHGIVYEGFAMEKYPHIFLTRKKLYDGHLSRFYLYLAVVCILCYSVLLLPYTTNTTTTYNSILYTIQQQCSKKEFQFQW